MADFTLPPLPYATSALEPHIDATTMEIHHGKHHAAYVNNLNAALKDHAAFHGKSIEEIISHLHTLPEAIRTAVRNNGGGHANHSMFWKLMKPGGGSGAPTAAVAQAIDADLGGLDKFKEDFTKAAMTRFGSGWAWLVVRDGKLAVTSTPNQDNPVMDIIDAAQKGIPILGLDVWEHAYYLKYQNRRPDYVAAWWHVVDWDAVEHRFHDAKAGKIQLT
jgi:Fe-Mn family superoxide dismutase